MRVSNANPVTVPQRNLIIRLSEERDLPELGATPALALERVVYLCDVDQTFGRRDASSLIDRLFAAPRRTAVQPTAVSGDQRTANRQPLVARVGVYRLDDRTYVVRKARGSERLYALELVSAPPRLMESGDVRNLELEYRPGLIYDLKDEHRLPAEEVEKVSRTYRRCIMCGHRLKAATSVQRAIGPVCWKKVS